MQGMGYISVEDLEEQKGNFNNSHCPQGWEHNREEVGLPEPRGSKRGPTEFIFGPLRKPGCCC